jgi:hypothetical protein
MTIPTFHVTSSIDASGNPHTINVYDTSYAYLLEGYGHNPGSPYASIVDTTVFFNFADSNLHCFKITITCWASASTPWPPDAFFNIGCGCLAGSVDDPAHYYNWYDIDFGTPVDSTSGLYTWIRPHITYYAYFGGTYSDWEVNAGLEWNNYQRVGGDWTFNVLIEALPDGSITPNNTVQNIIEMN